MYVSPALYLPYYVSCRVVFLQTLFFFSRSTITKKDQQTRKRKEKQKFQVEIFCIVFCAASAL